MEHNASLNKSNKKNKGFTLIEALIAMTIFALLLIFMAQSIIIAYRINFLSVVKNTALEIASNELENIRNMSLIYDVNGDGAFVTDRTDCPEPCTTNPPLPECKTTVRIRNTNVVFGKSVEVVPNGDIYEVTVTVCTDYKDWRTGEPIQVKLKTLIAGD